MDPGRMPGAMLSDLFQGIALVGCAVALIGVIVAAVRRPSHVMPLFGVLLAYVAFVAVLLAAALVLGMPGGLGFVLFLGGSAVFVYAFFDFSPWECWRCSNVNPPRAAACSSCGITRAGSDEIEAREIDRH